MAPPAFNPPGQPRRRCLHHRSGRFDLGGSGYPHGVGSEREIGAELNDIRLRLTELVALRLIEELTTSQRLEYSMLIERERWLLNEVRGRIDLTAEDNEAAARGHRSGAGWP